MEIGKMITGSPLMQSGILSEQSKSARARSNNHEQTTSKVTQDTNMVTQESDVTEEQLGNMIEGINSFLETANTGIRYELHEKLDRYFVTIIDKDTDEVVKEIPPKKMLDLYASMFEYMGFLVDKKI
ncbi:flagellar protein FlaG [Gracilibacillus alcaliphilus]|uniref:flagellar protein FlaG n=1 Tax=Gracilibacillus alcaliphilus TaxID=1401441 RepID=UPI001959D7C3|nr:flagellar protein FlaG [Gracilibacillus alcaliphilus]MBM7675999.1 flagellar protein FlaG [Gracilibacillus alcaliphilus]